MSLKEDIRQRDSLQRSLQQYQIEIMWGFTKILGFSAYGSTLGIIGIAAVTERFMIRSLRYETLKRKESFPSALNIDSE